MSIADWQEEKEKLNREVTQFWISDFRFAIADSTLISPKDVVRHAGTKRRSTVSTSKKGPLTNDPKSKNPKSKI